MITRALRRYAAFRGLTPILLVLALSSCTTLREPAAVDWDARRDALLQEQDWRLQGRVAIRSADGEGGQASLQWRQTGEYSELQLSGPFGTGRVDLFVSPQEVRLSDADGEQSIRYTGPDAAERFMSEHLGWSFPVASARYWMRGLLDPAADGKRQFAAGGELRGLRQHGWTVSLDRFEEYGGQLLPVRLVLENPRLRLKAVISEWLPAPELN